MTKIIQIATASEGSGESFWTDVIALTNDGKVFQLVWNKETNEYTLPVHNSPTQPPTNYVL